MLKPVTKFFLRLLLILSVIILFDRIAGNILEKLYFRQKHGPGYLTTYSIDSTEARILVFGSSRANHGYVPDIFVRELDRSFYNTGRDGTYILHNYAVFRSIMKRYSPEMIIFDLRPDELQYNVKEYDALSLLLPYCKKHPEIRQIVDMKGPFEGTKRFSAAYTYNSLIFQIIMGNSGKEGRYASSQGYIPLKRTMSESIPDTVDYSDFIPDQNKFLALKEINNTCRLKNIDVYFIQSPVWRINKRCVYWDIFCGDNNITYLDFSNNSLFLKHPEYFADKYHLNDEGAKVFSKLLTQLLRTSSSRRIIHD
ncbi:MAG TPA: hypothetical protein VHO68_11890 [Bacteroidales bacterium]|nr:hypothetical protein [Bacteroidales bacterium]